MVGNYYKRKTKRGAGGNWSLNDLESAMEAQKNGLSFGKAAVLFNIPKSTLILKMKGWKGRSSTSKTANGGGRSTTIPLEEEQKLAKNLKIMGKWGFGLSKNEVLDVVHEYIVVNKLKNGFKDDKPGEAWFKSFCTRYRLSLKKPEIVESSRSRQSNDPFVIKNFFEQLDMVLTELKIKNEPKSIFNCDESGFRSDPTTTKVVTEKGLRAKRITGGNARSTTTVLACVDAFGNKMPPLILHKGQRIWDSMMGENAYPETSYAVSENGWMTEKVFKNWFKEHFLKNLKSKPALLIYDGHLSHISIDLIETAIEAEVTILKLPPHTSHILQPLDVSVFKGVKSKWDSMLAEWARHNYGKTLSKSIFSNILGKVWTTVNPEVIKKGFEKCGIYPFNASKIEDHTFDSNKLARYYMLHPRPIQMVSEPVRIVPEIIQSEHVPEPIMEIVLDNNGQEVTPSCSLNVTISPSKSFEKILLKTVSPAVTSKLAKRKSRVDEAEIITRENYLQNLKENKEKKKVEDEIKAEKKLMRENAKTLKTSKENVNNKGLIKKKISKKKDKVVYPQKKFEKRCLF